MATKKRAARTTHAYTIKQAAELLGIGTTQVSQWRAKHLLIEYPDGSLDVESTLTRANQMLNPTQGGKPDRGFGGRYRAMAELDGGESIIINPTDPDAIVKAKTQLAIESARYKALQNAQLEKTLIPRDMVTEIFGDGLAAVRSALTSLPVRWRHKFVGLQPDEIERIIRTEVTNILREVADALDADTFNPDK